ncbi:hypothetical protein ACWEKR_24585 [Nocardia sp. NPDC004573]
MPRIQALGAAGQFQPTRFAGALVFDEQALPGVEVSFEFELAALLVCQVVFACVDAFELDALAFGGIECTHDRRKMTRYLRRRGAFTPDSSSGVITLGAIRGGPCRI